MNMDLWDKGMSGRTDPYETESKDSRLVEVEAEKGAALNNIDVTYGEMIKNSDSFYESQIEASKEAEEQQKKLQQEQTDFAIDQIEQQREQARKDYVKEQSGAYTDWQKQTNQYGVDAEKIASQGMAGTGYSESSELAAYNSYQYRLSSARESFLRANQDFDNEINAARLQNNSVMAQLALDAYQKRLELALAGFQYKNQLITEQTNKKLEVESLFNQKWLGVLDQINTEEALAEQIRQFNESMALEREQFEWQKERAGGSSGGSSGSGPGNPGGGTKAANTQKSLENMGLGHLSASEAAQLAADGELRVTTSTQNGEPLYSSVTSAGPKNDTSAYWDSQKK